MVMNHILFVAWQSALSFFRLGFFETLTLKPEVKVKSLVEEQGNLVSPVTNL